MPPAPTRWDDVDELLRDYVGSERVAALAAAAAAEAVGPAAGVPAEVADLSMGIALVVGRGNEAPLYEGAFGGWTGTEVVPVASAAKWAVAFAVLSLVADGMLSLDDPVARWMPGLVREPADTITVEQLLSHRAGLTPFHPVLVERGTTLADAASVILRSELPWAPGTGFAYGGSSMQVLGHLAELAAGASWHELFAARVARPLGAPSLSYGDTANPRVPGGMLATVRDYDRLLRAHIGGGVLDGERVLPAWLVEEMERDRTGPSPVPDPFGGERVGYGLGVWIEEVDRSGRTVQVSSPGAWGTRPWVDHGAGYRAVLSMFGLGLAGVALSEEISERLRPLIEQRVT